MKHETKDETARREALGRMLEAAEWPHVVTLTTKEPRSPEWLRAELEYRFIRRLARNAQGAVAWFAALEATADGQWHLHVLLGGTQRLRTQQLERAWKAGFTRVGLVRNSAGVIRYMTDTLGKHPENFDLSRRWIEKRAA